ncbi:MAG TPA: hydrogenase/urease maturation nickel metallochaperone HypA [Acidimicrobiales bacterium]|nr:hydrogenase/urease maturation nickel metallochaperone HypA [Acidimicrobiales bacterium]
MHELSLVSELVTRCSDLADGRTVTEVRVRCPLGIDADELVEGFALITSQLGQRGAGTLEGARLELEQVAPYLKCLCGFSGRLSAEDVAGHISVCPQCGQVGELPSRLELVSVAFAPKT